MKSVLELNRLTIIEIPIVMLSDIQERSRKDHANFDILGIIWESKRSWRVHFQAFRGPKIQNFDNHGATSGIYRSLLKTSRFELFGGRNV